MVQNHKKFMDSHVKEFFAKYLNKEIERKYVQQILAIKERRFFHLINQYKKIPVNFFYSIYPEICNTHNIS